MLNKAVDELRAALSVKTREANRKLVEVREKTLAAKRIIKDPKQLGGVGRSHMDAQLRHNHFPVTGGLVNNLQPVPDFQQLQKDSVIAADFPLLVFIQKEIVFISKCTSGGLPVPLYSGWVILR